MAGKRESVQLRTAVRVPPNASDPSTSTTQLYNRREDRVTLDEVVRINIRRPAYVTSTKLADQITAAQKSASVFGTGTLRRAYSGNLLFFWHSMLTGSWTVKRSMLIRNLICTRMGLNG